MKIVEIRIVEIKCQRIKRPLTIWQGVYKMEIIQIVGIFSISFIGSLLVWIYLKEQLK